MCLNEHWIRVRTFVQIKFKLLSATTRKIKNKILFEELKK